MMRFLDSLASFVPTALAVAGVVIVLFAVRYILNKRFQGALDHQFKLQLMMLVLSFVGLLVVILALPISEATVGQLLSLIGLLLSAAIALSATTFLGNIMAGLMQRAVKSFRPGDFIRVGDHSGRVSEQGLFHVEIQTADRDLTTMPNLYLVTNPVQVIRADGALVSAQVSLGYDVHHARIEEALLQAAADTELEEPFVHVIALGDFSVTYKVAGLLKEVKKLLSTGSRLKVRVLDRLHAAGIEIVSPNFMNQRVLQDQAFVPEPVVQAPGPGKDEATPEEIVFDKAEQAESLEALREQHELLNAELEQLRSRAKETEIETEKTALTREIELGEAKLVRLAERITAWEEKV